MTINFDRAFGSHDQALIVRAHRAKLLAENIANADTPGYRARDLDFSRLVKAFSVRPALTSTDQRHISQVHSTSADVAAAGGAGAVVYRTPTQASLDGNTVDAHAEKARFLENAIRYQASLTFLNGRIEALRVAIGGQ